MKTGTKTFADYKPDADKWITLAGGEYYPDVLKDACDLYEPVLVLFGQLLRSSETSSRLFSSVLEVTNSWMRTQLLRVFKRYVCPVLPVEMTKRKTKAGQIQAAFAAKFRPITDVHRWYDSRPVRDEALCALLWEYKDRGKKGYDLTERFFAMFRLAFPDLEITGSERAGKDILLGNVFKNYPRPDCPIDFIIKQKKKILAVGLARYDSDRGGAQEDDRTGGYTHSATEFVYYAQRAGLSTKLIFVNDGPGLLLGSMWQDYSSLEKIALDQIIVLTLRMVPDRLTRDWLLSGGC